MFQPIRQFWTCMQPQNRDDVRRGVAVLRGRTA
jgi:hypothetical protein